MSTQAPSQRPRAVLVAVQTPGVSDDELHASLAELARLCDTFGLDVVGEVTQRRAAPDRAAVLGKGKLRELAKWTGGKGVVPRNRKAKAGAEDEDEDDADDALDEAGEDGDDAEADDAADGDANAPPAERVRADVVVVDDELSPSQLYRLEQATRAEVLDRTGVIIEIFHRHARSREARAQVEIARLNYIAPRLRAKGGGGDRQRGGIGGKGAGESQLETDRRKVRDRVAELRAELASIEHQDDVRRQRRRTEQRVALVGYTNAGKSSLMRALTGKEVYVADRLFATLDTTVRTLHPETRPRILVSDTVGFIKKLPHDLVASFRSTLDEALEASLLLFVVDASDPSHRSQLAVTQQVLGEIGCDEVPRLVVLNKIDRVDAEGRAALALEHPGAIQISALDPDDVSRLRERLIAQFEHGMGEAELRVSHAARGVLGEVYANARVLSEEWDQDGVMLRLRAPEPTLARLRALATR